MDRVCIWCDREIPEKQGVHLGLVRRMACIGRCADSACKFTKDYSKSKHGRFNTKRRFLQLIRQAKESERASKESQTTART